MRKRFLRSLFVALTAVLLLGCPTPVTPPTDTTITLLVIPGVTAPVLGAAPVTSIDASQYTGAISWTPAVSGTFGASTAYTATITLTPKAGYTLTGVADNSFTVTGATSVFNSANSGVITAVFPSTSATITLLDIPGVTAPVFGATPATSIDASQYSGTISWSPVVSGTFGASTSYTATITLSPKAGYTLTGVAANRFSVTDATSVFNSVNSGMVTAVFSSTAVNLAPVSDVTSASIGLLKGVRGDTFFLNNYTTVSSFRICQHEITGEEYAMVMGVTDPSYYSSVTGHPVENVNWYETLVFCNKLSMAEGLTPVYTISASTDPADWGAIPTSDNATWNAVIVNWGANGYRLPTWMEWLLAARGGYCPQSYTYAGSESVNDVAWYDGNSEYTTHAVGGKKANSLDLYDMSGNVWEWCWDWYEASSYSGGKVDYRGPASGTCRVMCGGSFVSPGNYCSVTSQEGADPYIQIHWTGFRVVRP